MASSEEELWNQYQYKAAEGKPTEDQLWGQYQETTQNQSTAVAAGIPYSNTSGPLADAAYAVGKVGKVLTAAGQGAADEWGVMKGVTGQSLYESMDPEDAKNDKAIVKSGNEGWLRPLAAKIAAQELANVSHIAAPVMVAGAGAMAGVQELGEQLPRPLGETLELGLGAAPALHIPEGGIPEEAPTTVDLRPWVNTTQRLQEARAKGVIGPEGERGFFGLTEITPAERQARMEAAQESGSTAILENGKPPTLDDLAQRINPEAFQQRADLQDQLDLIQRSRAVLRDQKEELPEIKSLRDREAAILDTVNGNEEELSEPKADELSKVRDGLDELITKESPEETALNQSHIETLNKLNEIQPYINEAYTHAQSLFPKEAPGSGKVQAEGATEAPETRTAEGVVPSTEDTGTGPGGSPKGFKSLSGAATPEDLKAQINKELADSDEFRGVEPLTKKDQINKASDLVINDPKSAIDVINGNLIIPGIHPQVLLRALSVKAMAEQDLDLARLLARSHANRMASEAGQTLSMRSGINADVNPVDLIGDAERAKRVKAGGFRQAEAAIQTTSDSIKKTVQNAVFKFNDDWRSFINDLACDE